MLKLLSIYERTGIDERSPLMAYTEGNKWAVWKREEATGRLLGEVEVVGRK